MEKKWKGSRKGVTGSGEKAEWKQRGSGKETERKPRGLQRSGKELTAHYQPSILSAVERLQTPGRRTSMLLKLILWVPVCTIKTWKFSSDILRDFTV